MTPMAALASLIVLGAWTGLARATLDGPYFAAVLDVALVGLLLYGLARGRTVWTTVGRALGVLVAAYLGLAVLEILNQNVPSVRVGLEGFRKTAFTMLAFFVVIRLGDDRPSWFFKVVAIGSLPALLFGIRQFVAPAPFDIAILTSSGVSSISFHSGTVLRAFSPTAGPFHLGGIAASVVVIALVQSRNGSRAWLAAALVAAATLGLTLTRANLAAAIAAMVVVALISPYGRGRLRALLEAAPIAATAGLAAVLAVGALTFGLPTIDGSGPGATPGPGTGGTVGEVVRGVLDPIEDKNLQLRFGYWREYLVAVSERPIIGYGTSAAADGFDHFYASTGHKNFEPHSLYFKSALELGLIGLAIMLAILALATVIAVRTIRSSPVLGLTAFGILIVIGVSGVTGPMLDAYPVNLLFWATLGWLARGPVDEAVSSVAEMTRSAT